MKRILLLCASFIPQQIYAQTLPFLYQIGPRKINTPVQTENAVVFSCYIFIFFFAILYFQSCFSQYQVLKKENKIPGCPVKLLKLLLL